MPRNICCERRVTVDSFRSFPLMSAFFFKSFLRRPLEVASIVPSSKVLVDRVARRMDFSRPRRIVELGAGEGAHSRELRRRLGHESRLLLFELNAELARKLEMQFAGDDRVEVVHGDASSLSDELEKRSWDDCDYVLSGIPFSLLEKEKKRDLIRTIHDALAPEPHAAFIIYQVTPELREHVPMFHREISEYCVRNIPPMFVKSFHKLPEE